MNLEAAQSKKRVIGNWIHMSSGSEVQDVSSKSWFPHVVVLDSNRRPSATEPPPVKKQRRPYQKEDAECLYTVVEDMLGQECATLTEFGFG